jgi:hypothetical protein
MKYTKDDAQRIVENGKQYKKIKPIWGIVAYKGDVVETFEGTLILKEDGIIATDGERVWPVDDTYLNENYEEVR